MKFIDTLIQKSPVKEAKLYGPSKKASENPETGIIIQTTAAFHVIKDCATIAHKYLPHYIFGSYANPFEVLKGMFSKQDIEEFVSAAMSDIILNQLLVLILEKIKGVPYITTTTVTADITNSNSIDPYGEYETYSSALKQEKQQDPVTLLCIAFNV